MTWSNPELRGFPRFGEIAAAAEVRGRAGFPDV